MLPNFLIIGAAKAGTTALWQYLRQHPDIYMSPHKEPRYFALCGQSATFQGPGDSRFRLVTDFASYRELFRSANGQQAIGEASPWYLYVPSAAPSIKDALPDAKLVAILRDPVDRAFSNYLHAVREGVEPLPSFSAAMDAEDERIRMKWSPRFHYKQKGFYFAQLVHYLHFFPREQLKVLLYDDFCERPTDVLHELFMFLNIDPNAAINTRQRHNDSRTTRSKRVDNLLKHGSRITNVLGPCLPAALRRNVKHQIARLNLKPKPKLSPDDRRRFVDLYRRDIEQLQELIDRDLQAWIS